MSAISTIAKEVLGSIASTITSYSTVLIAAATFAAGAWCGYQWEHSNLVSLQQQLTESTIKQQEQLLKLEADYAKRLAESQQQYAVQVENLNSSNRSLNESLERMRKAAANTGKVSRTKKAAVVSSGTADERCKQLLLEGSELLREGNEVLGRNAAKHDALVTIVR